MTTAKNPASAHPGTGRTDRTGSAPEADAVSRAAKRSSQLLQTGNRWTAVAILAAVALWSGAVFVVVRGGLVDDAYITLSYARSLAFHLHWGLIPQETANSATSPLNVLVLGAATAVLRAPLVGLGAVFVLANVVLAGALWRAARSSGMPGASGVLGVLLVLGNPLVLSSVGMEMALAAALLGLLLLAAVERRPVLFGVAAGLLALTRLDLVVFPLAVFVGRPVLWRALWRALGTACAVALPWFAFSWWHFGSAIPDTLAVKLIQRSWGGWTFTNGLALYYTRYPVAIILSVVAAGLALVGILVWLVLQIVGRPGPATLDPWVLVGIGAAAHFLVYTRIQVPPYHWYYAPSLIGLSITFAGMVGAIAAAARSVPSRVVAELAGALAIVLVAAQVSLIAANGMPWRQAVINSNWGKPADYARIGQLLRQDVGSRTVSSPGEIGGLAYFCGCSIVDDFADRGHLAGMIRQRIAHAEGLQRWLMELNFARFPHLMQRPVEFALRREDGQADDPRWNISSSWSRTTHLRLHLDATP